MELKKLAIWSLISVLSSPTSFAFYTKEGQIYDKNGNLVQIDGISWSGFQDSKILQGLASNPLYSAPGTSYPKSFGMLDALVHPWDFTDAGVNKSNSVGFKTVRVPIQPGVLSDTTGQVDLNKAITNKAEPTKGNGIFCAIWETQGSACSQTVSPKDAFWIALTEFKKNNVKVLIDFHHGYGYGDNFRDGTVYSLSQYQADIKLILDEIKTRNLTNVIGIDLFNEPYRLQWFNDNAGQPAWSKVIAAAANVLMQNNSDLLLFIEGAGPGSGDPSQPVICVKQSDLVADDEAYSISPDPSNCAANTQRVEFKGNWGEDFKPLLDGTNAKQGVSSFNRTGFISQLKKANLSDAALSWLLGDANGNQAHIVFSPHVYPREVGTWESAPGKPSALRFDWSWGFLKKAGYAVVLGESSWKTKSGSDFFQNALVPYLKQNGLNNNLFFWAVGYLGDTISLIDPNSGSLNLNAEKILHDLFAQSTDTGLVNLNFTMPGFKITGAAELTLKETQQNYACSYEGCSLTLNSGSYTLTVRDSYQIDPTAHLVYLVKAINSPLSFSLAKAQSVNFTLNLEGQQLKAEPATQVNYKINLLDEKGNALGNGSVTTNLTFVSTANSQNSLNCSIVSGSCTATAYNHQINTSTGVFGTENYRVVLPNTLLVNGKTYSLVSNKSAVGFTVMATSNSLQLNAFYQASAVSTKDCSVNFQLQNRWDNGAVYQGTLTNTSQSAIRHFIINLNFNNSEVTNPSIAGFWFGNNSTVIKEGSNFVFKADTYDSYNGLKPGQSQSIGFQLAGTVLSNPTVNILGCEASS